MTGLLFREAPKLADEEPTSERKVPWLSLLAKRQAWAYMIAKFLTDPVWWFYLIWLPDYFKASRGINITRSWLHLVIIYAIVTVLSIAGGMVSGVLIMNTVGCTSTGNSCARLATPRVT